MIAVRGEAKQSPIIQSPEKGERKSRIIEQIVDHLQTSHSSAHESLRVVQSHIAQRGDKHHEEDSSGANSSLPNTLEVCGKRRVFISRQIEALNRRGVTLHSVVEIGAIVKLDNGGQVIHLLITEHLGGEQIEIVDDPIGTLNLVKVDAPIAVSIAGLAQGGQGGFRDHSIKVLEVF